MLGKIDEGKHKTHLRWFGHAPIQKKKWQKKNDSVRLTNASTLFRQVLYVVSHF